MPFDSNGTFNRVIAGGWQADAAAGTKITAIRHDAEDDGFAAGLSTCITKDGRTQPTANIPMNNKKIIDLAEPTLPDDAATKNYVDTFKAFTTGVIINGAGPINGFLQFTSPTGVNGIGWTNADMSWIGRVAEVDKYNKRLAVNDAKDGTGTDVFAIDEAGRVNSSGVFSNNLTYDGAAWRTPLAGIGTLLTLTGGVFDFRSNDTATAGVYLTPALRSFARLQNSAGSTVLTLNKTASGKGAHIYGAMADKLRWRMDLGNATAETATERVGSDFYLYTYNNAGTTAYPAMAITRSTLLTTFFGGVSVTGQLTTNDQLNFDSILQSIDAAAILASTSGGTIYLRPNGAGSTVEQVIISNTGDMQVSCDIWAGSAGHTTFGVYGGAGYRGKAGQTGSYGSYFNNMNWNGTYMYVYTSTTLLGAITWQCDYRIKKNVQSLPSVWERVKALNPVRFQQKAYDVWVDNDDVRWGFIAHELQERLDPAMATGHKDSADIQSPDLLGILAAVTRALQEAMLRIEALEAA